MSSEQGRVAANGVELAYDRFGDPADPAIVLVMGLGTQRLAWPDQMCEDLAVAGHHVVRFDNRDVGESTHLHEAGTPSLGDMVRRRHLAYRLDDMADDVAGLLDALDLGTVHLVGASMGGFIAQTVAIRHPRRLRTLTLIMTSTGARRVGRPHPSIMRHLLRRPVTTDRAEAVAAAIAIQRLIGSPGYPADEAHLATLAGTSFDRGHDPAGHRRQLAAILAQPDRTRDLAAITVPTLVMHGLADRLVAPSGGLAVAAAIARSTFVGFSGMGHDLPRPLWPAITREILALATRPESVVGTDPPPATEPAAPVLD